MGKEKETIILLRKQKSPTLFEMYWLPYFFWNNHVRDLTAECECQKKTKERKEKKKQVNKDSTERIS